MHKKLLVTILIGMACIGYLVEHAHREMLVNGQVTDNAWDEVEPVASRNGQQILYFGGDLHSRGGVAVYRWTEARGAERLAKGQSAAFYRGDQYILWSRSGDASVGGNPARSDIWIMNNDEVGSGKTPYIVNNSISLGKPNEVPGSGGDVIYHTWHDTWSIRGWNKVDESAGTLPVIDIAQQPRVSPDGRYVVYHSQSPPGTPFDVYLYDLVNGKEARLTWDGAEQGYPSFSPDGQWIVYQSKEDGGDFFDLWAMDLSRKNRQQVTFEDTDQRYPSFMPDGNAVLYSSKEDWGRYWDIWRVPVEIRTTMIVEEDVAPRAAPVETKANPSDRPETAALLTERVTSLGRPPAGYEVVPESVVISPDGRHIAYVVRSPESEVVMLDGEAGGPYDEIVLHWPMVFSPDSSRFAYVGKRRGQAFAVVDGKEGKASADVGTPVFSPDSKRVAYPVAVRQDPSSSRRTWLVVVDGKETSPCEDPVMGLRFSPDSQRLAYNVWDQSVHKRYWVVDGAKYESYDLINVGLPMVTPFFSPDSAHFAYPARLGEKEFVVHDGKEGPHYDETWGIWPVFSPDSAHLAYSARKGNGHVMVLDSEEGPLYYDVSRPVFSPDSSRLAYWVRKKGKAVIVLDGKEGPSYDATSFPTFSADSSKLAHAGRRGRTLMLVVNNVETESWATEERVHDVTLSPDLKKVAWIEMSGDGGGDGWIFFDGEWREIVGGGSSRVVVDDRRGERFAGVSSPVFSPDSSQVGYLALGKKGWCVSVDGSSGASYDRIHVPPLPPGHMAGSRPKGVPVFGPDSRHFAYLAQRDGKWRIVVDGEEGAERFSQVLGDITFDSPPTLSFFALRGSEWPDFTRVQVEVLKEVTHGP